MYLPDFPLTFCPDPHLGFFDWSKASAQNIDIYSNSVSASLSEVSIPSCLLSCDATCHDPAHHQAITEYYNEVTNCLKTAVEASIPYTKLGCNKYNVAGWTDYVSDKHSVARQAFLDWVAVGKPRSGMLYQHINLNSHNTVYR